jgi:hypothetical protein
MCSIDSYLRGNTEDLCNIIDSLTDTANELNQDDIGAYLHHCEYNYVLALSSGCIIHLTRKRDEGAMIIIYPTLVKK